MVTLVIVESPGKVEKIQKWIGSNYKVVASKGHIFELPKKGYGFDTKNLDTNFEVQYKLITKQQALILKMRSLYKKCNDIIIATDRDLEGAAIGFHCLEALQIDWRNAKRAVFTEITKSAIIKAIANPVSMDFNSYRAQKARRLMDRIVGFLISPVVRKHVINGQSAGRCQSCALNLIVDRNNELNEPTITNNVIMELGNSLNGLTIKFKPNKSVTLTNKELKKWCDIDYFIENIKETNETQNPPPAFTTSTVQQAAGQFLGYSPKSTMSLLQKLYTSGKITYHRTDSISLSKTFLLNAQKHVKANYGDELLKPRFYSRGKKGQEAHEAIRPTNINTTSISGNTAALYKLIYNRALATQIKSVQKKVLTIKIKCELGSATLTSKKIIFNGYKILTGKKEDKNPYYEHLLKLKNGEKLTSIKQLSIQQIIKSTGKTRFTEYSLVSTLEKVGVGRPSTFSTIIQTLYNRQYIIKNSETGTKTILKGIYCNYKSDKIKKSSEIDYIGKYHNKIVPTEAGIAVIKYLKDYFSEITQADFTATVELNLDRIAAGQLNWRDDVRRIWNILYPRYLEERKRKKEVREKRKPFALLDEIPVYVYVGRFGPVVKLGDGKEAKFASIPKQIKIDKIKMDDIKFLLSLPLQLNDQITLKNGRYGFYIQKDKETRSISSYIQAKQLTEAKAIELLSKPPIKKKFRKFKKWKNK